MKRADNKKKIVFELYPFPKAITLKKSLWANEFSVGVLKMIIGIKGVIIVIIIPVRYRIIVSGI